VVMSVGGWSSFQMIELYLNEPSEEVVNRAFLRLGSAELTVRFLSNLVKQPSN
jgi:hypothetical protein